MKEKEQIENYIAKNQTEKAIQLLRTLTKGVDNNRYQQILLVSRRYYELKDKLVKNIIPAPDAEIEQSRINNALLNILNNKAPSLPSSSYFSRYLALFLFVFLIGFGLYFFKKESIYTAEPPRQEEKIVAPEAVTVIEETINEDRGESKPQIENQTKPKEVEPVKTKKETFLIDEVIQFQGKALADAYFKIKGCKACKSTLSGKDGSAQLEIPSSMVRDGNKYVFYVYVKDSLLYQKSMRINNLQFNEY